MISGPISIVDAIENINAPSTSWFVDNFEVRLPNILEAINKSLYSSFVQPYNEYLYYKQNPSKAVKDSVGRSDSPLLISPELFTGQYKVPEPISHERFERRVERK